MKNRFNKIFSIFALTLLVSFLLVSCSSKKVCPNCGAEVDHLTSCDVCGGTCCERCAAIDTSLMCENYYDEFVDYIWRHNNGVIVDDYYSIRDFIADYEEEVLEGVEDCCEDLVIIDRFYDIFVDYVEGQGYVIVEAGD